MTNYVDGRTGGGGGGGNISNFLLPGADTIPDLEAIASPGLVDKVLIGVKDPASTYIWDSTSTDAPTGTDVVIPNDIIAPDPGRWLQTNVNAAGANQVEFLEVNFSFNSTSPLVVAVVGNGQTIANSELCITTPFDDPTATLSLGTFADSSLILPSSKINPQMEAAFSTEENFAFTSSESVILTITPQASTQGEGSIFFEIKRI